MAEPMLPVRYRVVDRTVETHDSATLRLEPVDRPLAPFRPGQFAMLYAYGVGEVPISISGIGDDGTLLHTIRSVGAVSRALHGAGPGTVIGARGPFGTAWAAEDAVGNDLVVVAGGVGLAPLRPVVLAALATRAAYRRVVVIAGARTPDEFLFRAELDRWAAHDDLEVELTIDSPSTGWNGTVGFVTEPLARLRLDPERTVAFLCGPEPMMRFSARVLLRALVPAERIRVSLERSMKCGIGLCGHCQLGPLLLCRDGPVVTSAVAEPLLTVAEL
ncbi:FAD/NAD(P)-binding protein [Kribbella sp. NPDC000426]|uniref:FAD/NAD(P)-binding protein n=1 Tax=Kribbella sp. NPDC000426 TaxID=3154255 RepID=UPI003327214B